MKRGPSAPGFDVSRDVIFLGIGVSSVNYYRCVLPAQELGADWLGVTGEPPKLKFATGSVRGNSGIIPDLLGDYKIVVLQQVRGTGWVRLIEEMQAAGVKVIYEIDDYVHGIKHMKDEHGFHKDFGNEVLWHMEQAMKRCDAVITTTDWIKGCYSHFNKNIHICENGLDLRRYELTRPERPTVNIGWSGGTGHKRAVGPWLAQVSMVMQMRPRTGFVSVGEPFARFLMKYFPDRAIAIPWAAIEQYPSAMTMFDIALAPAGSGGWWRGKCLDSTTRVSTGRGLLPIGEVEVGDRIFDGLQWRGVEATHREPAKPGLKLTTVEGLSVKVSPEHRLMTSEGWREAAEIGVGAQLRTGSMRAAGAVQAFRAPLLHTGVRSDWEPSPAAESLPLIEIDENWAELLGIYAGDGSVNRRKVAFSCCGDDPDVSARVVELLASVGLRGIVTKKKTFNGKPVNMDSVVVSATKLVSLLKSIGMVDGDGRRDVCVPEVIWRSTEPVIRAFLRGYFEADGSVGVPSKSHRSPKIEAISKDWGFAEDVQRLLLCFGISSRLSRKPGLGEYADRVYARLTIGAYGARLFREKIGFVSSRKTARLDAWGHPDYSRGGRANPPGDFQGVASIEECWIDPVDLQVEGEAFVAAGIVSHNSHLRWLEASALGIPVIANPEVYPAIVEGETGFHAASVQEATEKMLLLIDNPDIREKVGAQARAHIREKYSISAVAPQWLDVFNQLLE